MITVERLPSYDELPVTAGAPVGSSWGLWGEDDVLGCLNLLTPERVRQAAGLVRSGTVFPLGWDLALPDPPLFGRSPFAHEVAWIGFDGIYHDDSLSGWNTQSSTQWDGFRHAGFCADGEHTTYYNGIADAQHGVHHWARRGVAGRCVLADVARWREQAGRPLRLEVADQVSVADLQATLEHQGTTVRPGDILLVRTGWVGWYGTLDVAGRQRLARLDAEFPGLAPGQEMLRFLWDLHIAAVAADNPSVETWPPRQFAKPGHAAREHIDPADFLHPFLLSLLGLPLGELFALDDLAAACAADGAYESFFTSAPLHLPGGVATPPNATAIR